MQHHPIVPQQLQQQLSLQQSTRSSGSTQSLDHQSIATSSSALNTPQQPSVKSMPKCNLFIARLPSPVKSEDLAEYYAKYGKVVMAKVMEDLKTGRSRQFGFVMFADQRSARDALVATNNQPYDGFSGSQPLQVAFSSHDDSSRQVECDRLYVRNLPHSVDEGQLTDIFINFEGFLQSTLLKDSAEQKSGGSLPFSEQRRVACVKFVTVAQAKVALEAMNGSTVFGQNYPLQIRFMESSKMRDQRRKQKKVEETQKKQEKLSKAGAPQLRTNSEGYSSGEEQSLIQDSLPRSQPVVRVPQHPQFPPFEAAILQQQQPPQVVAQATPHLVPVPVPVQSAQPFQPIPLGVPLTPMAGGYFPTASHQQYVGGVVPHQPSSVPTVVYAPIPAAQPPAQMVHASHPPVLHPIHAASQHKQSSQRQQTSRAFSVPPVSTHPPLEDANESAQSKTF